MNDNYLKHILADLISNIKEHKKLGKYQGLREEMENLMSMNTEPKLVCCCWYTPSAHSYKHSHKITDSPISKNQSSNSANQTCYCRFPQRQPSDDNANRFPTGVHRLTIFSPDYTVFHQWRLPYTYSHNIFSVLPPGFMYNAFTWYGEIADASIFKVIE